MPRGEFAQHSMDPTSVMPLLAALPDGLGHIDPIKVGVVVVLLFAWAAAVQWVDKDTDVVKTKREQWGLIVLSGADPQRRNVIPGKRPLIAAVEKTLVGH